MILSKTVACAVFVLVTSSVLGVCVDVNPILNAYRLEIMSVVSSILATWLSLIFVYPLSSGFVRRLAIYAPVASILSTPTVHLLANLLQARFGIPVTDTPVVIAFCGTWFLVWIFEAKTNTLRNKILDLLNQVTLGLLNKASDSIKSKFGGGDA
jgi:hypothetical protein